MALSTHNLFYCDKYMFQADGSQQMEIWWRKDSIKISKMGMAKNKVGHFVCQ